MFIERNGLNNRKLSTWQPEKGAILEPQRQDYKPWHATPGNVCHPGVVLRQSEARGQTAASLALAIERRPPFANPDHESYVNGLDAFVEMVYWARGANRAIKNTDSFNQPLYDRVDLDPTQRAKLEKAELGSAEPDEILELIDKLGMGSAELAGLTHIYGYRIEFQQAMREHVKDAINSRGGDVYDKPEITYDIIAVDTSITHKDHLSIAIAMKRNTVVGCVDETVIYERTTFIVRIDKASQLDQKVAEYLRTISLTKQKAGTGPSDDPIGWKDQVMQDGRLVEEIKWLLESNAFESVIPMSTTIFASNDANHKLLEARREQDKLPLRQRNEASTPELQVQRFQQHMGAAAVLGSI